MENEDKKTLKLKNPKFKIGENRIYRKGRLQKYKEEDLVNLIDLNGTDLCKARILEVRTKQYKIWRVLI